jgi:parallel beta-helix repeat protein
MKKSTWLAVILRTFFFSGFLFTGLILATTAEDINSVSVDPDFVSDINFHPAQIASNNTGIALTEITSDITGIISLNLSDIEAFDTCILPGDAGSITGVMSVCPGAKGVIYKIDEIPFATGYIWNLPAGATIASGANTDSITVDFSLAAISGSISVNAVNDCGNGIASPEFVVTVNPLPAAVAGLDRAICMNTSTTLGAPAIAGSTYSWTSVPAGFSSVDAGPSVTPPSSGGAPAGSLNVKDYGATGNGSTDETNAIQSAIDAVSPGGTVYIPDGTYMINATAIPSGGTHGLEINGKSNVTINLSSRAVLKAITNSSDSYEILRIVYSSNITITGGTLLGDKDTHTSSSGEDGTCLTILGSQYVTLDGVTFRKGHGDGIYVQKTGSGVRTQHMIARNIMVDGNYRQGIAIVDGDDILIENSTIKNSGGLPGGGGGIDMEPNANETVNNIRIIGNTIANQASTGIGGGGRYLSGAVTTNVVVTGNTVSGNGIYGIYFNDNSDSTVISSNSILNNGEAGIGLGSPSPNSQVLNNIITGTVGTGIYIEDSKNSVIKGNRISNSTGPGIDGTYRGTGVIFSGNYVWSNGKTSVPSSLDTNAPDSSTITSVSVLPSTLSINSGAQTQFTSIVTGTDSFSLGVTWFATRGTITSSGLYTAPSTAGSDTVIVRSSQDITKTAQAIMTVTTPVQATTYTVQETITATGCTNTHNVVVTVNPLPLPEITGPASICAGLAGNMYTASAGMTHYIWTISAAGTITEGGTETDSTVTVAWNTAGNQTVSLNFTNENQCISDAPTFYEINVKPIPEAPLITPIGSLITSNAVTGNQWYKDGVEIAGATLAHYAVTKDGNYSCVITVNGCSSPVSNILNVIGDGINDIAAGQFELYPVPSKGLFMATMTWPKAEMFTIRVYNGAGSLMYEKKDIMVNGRATHLIDLSNAPDGVYMVTFSSGKSQMIKKMIINR